MQGLRFVTPDEGEQDIFVHFSAMHGWLPYLKEGQRREFDVEEGPKVCTRTPAAPQLRQP